MRIHNLTEEVTQQQLDALEKYADKLFAKVGIDVNFTKHFIDRVNDERNKKPISIAELVRLFKQEYKRWAKPIAQMGPDAEAVMKDMTTDVNLPFVLKWDKANNELDLVAKTVMRKQDFKTPDREFPVENAPGTLGQYINWAGKNKPQDQNKNIKQPQKNPGFFKKIANKVGNTVKSIFDDIDITELKIVKPDPKDTMGVLRKDMPQIEKDDYPEFITYLRSNGIKFTMDNIDANDLKPIQSEFSDVGVEKQIIKNIQGKRKPTIISSDNFVVDGHHRWLVAKNTGDTLEVLKANMPIDRLFPIVLKFPKVSFKDIYTEESEREELYKLTKKALTTIPNSEIQKQVIERLNVLCKNLNIEPITESLTENKNAQVYVDMDGVLADFFGAWAKLMNVGHYKEIQPVSKGLKAIKQEKDFWENIPPLRGMGDLLKAIEDTYGSYTILSSPLANDPNCIPGKYKWIDKNLNIFKPSNVIIDKDKAKYAKQSNGTPNILIDDFGKNIMAWEGAGGIAIKHHHTSVQNTIKELKNMVLKEEKLDTTIITPDIKDLGKLFKKNGYEVRVVGGAVRDVALGKQPKDIDFATDATPDEMIAMFDKAGVKHVPTGIEHGTITAVYKNNPYEITTLRADVETDGRRAEVQFVRNWEEDAKRRDLTYNAMSMDMDGTIYDYHGGMDDLQNKVSKFVGDPAERIKEDYLRILRYFRFQSKLDKPNFDKETLKAIKDNAKGLGDISVERVWQEMSKLLTGPSASDTIKQMNATGVADIIGLPTKNADMLKYDNPIMNLSLLVDDNTLVNKWRLSNKEADELGFYLNHKNSKLSKNEIENLIVDGADRQYLSNVLKIQGQDSLVNHVENFDAPQFPVTGSDLIAKGKQPGPSLGKTLNDLEDKWKQSRFKLNKDELLSRISEGNKNVTSLDRSTGNTLQSDDVERNERNRKTSNEISIHERQAVEKTKESISSSVNEFTEHECEKGEYWCNESGKCKPIPAGHYVDASGWLVKEEGPFGVIARKAGHVLNKSGYMKAAEYLHNILKRKYNETNGKLRHSLGYYTQMIASQTGMKLNWRELEQEYLDMYGNKFFENITEAVSSYTDPKFEVEWDEAKRYPEFEKLGKDKWIELAKKGKPIDVDNALANKIENTEAGEEHRHEFDNLEEPKKERFRKAVEAGTIELPIIARYSDGYLELVAGNTRLTGMMREFGKGKAWIFDVPDEIAVLGENFADGKKKGKSRPGRVKRAGASCKGSVTDLRRKAKNSSGEKAKMYHWCANMKSGRKKSNEEKESTMSFIKEMYNRMDDSCPRTKAKLCQCESVNKISEAQDGPVMAMCEFTKEHGVEGLVVMTQAPNTPTLLVGEIQGLKPGKHGFHIHEFGDLSNGCETAGAHYNPDNVDHGDLQQGHVGDLENVIADENGVAKIEIIAPRVDLLGERSIIGRSLVIHEDEDDLGKGGDAESLKTGNAGKRLGCGVIAMMENKMDESTGKFIVAEPLPLIPLAVGTAARAILPRALPALARGAKNLYKGARNIIGKNKGATSSADDVVKVTKPKPKNVNVKPKNVKPKNVKPKNTKTNTTTRARDEKGRFVKKNKNAKNNKTNNKAIGRKSNAATMGAGLAGGLGGIGLGGTGGSGSDEWSREYSRIEAKSSIGKALLEQLPGGEGGPIPKGTTVKGPDGDEYTWMGAQWVNKRTGRMATKDLRAKLPGGGGAVIKPTTEPDKPEDDDDEKLNVGDIVKTAPEVGKQLAQKLGSFYNPNAKGGMFSTGDLKVKRTEAAGVGKIVKGVNTTPDVGVDAIKKQAKKFGFDVDNEGRPKHKFR